MLASQIFRVDHLHDLAVRSSDRSVRECELASRPGLVLLCIILDIITEKEASKMLGTCKTLQVKSQGSWLTWPLEMLRHQMQNIQAEASLQTERDERSHLAHQNAGAFHGFLCHDLKFSCSL